MTKKSQSQQAHRNFGSAKQAGQSSPTCQHTVQSWLSSSSCFHFRKSEDQLDFERTVTFSEWRGSSWKVHVCFPHQYLKFCLLTYPLRWKCASSLTRQLWTTSPSWPITSVDKRVVVCWIVESWDYYLYLKWMIVKVILQDPPCDSITKDKLYAVPFCRFLWTSCLTHPINILKSMSDSLYHLVSELHKHFL